MRRVLRGIRSNLSRAIFCPRFLLSVAVCMVIQLMCIWDVIQMRGNNVTYLLFWMLQLGTIQPLLVCVPAMVYSDSFLEDAKGATVRFNVQRIGVVPYLAIRYISAVIGGFLVMVVSFGLFLGILSLFMPIDDSLGNMVLSDIITGSYKELIVQGKFAAYLMMNVLHQGICGMFYAGMALMCSAFIDNSFVVIAAPLLLYQWCDTLANLLGLKYSIADIQFCMTDLENPLAALANAFGRFFLLTLICGIVFVVRGRRRVRDAV